jgi:colanic acid/amylovoran biosynthesis glycosyltransferase
VSEFNPDIVHFHFGDTAVKFFFQLKNEFKNIPIFITFHGFDASELLNKDWYLKRLKKIVLQPNFYCICVSDNLMKNLLKNGLAVSPAKSFILHYGIDFNRFILEPRIEASAISFLQISTFFEKKGHAYTLEAFSRFKKITGKQVKLILAGDGPLLNDMKNLAEHLQISDDVVFTGWVSRDQARILLQKANYFVHHSITSESGDQEGIPNAIIEAMAMELPVLSTWHSGIPELVENGVNGFLVNERDVEGYALCFEKILSWGYLSRNREKVLNGFSEEKHISDLINIYNFSLRF